MNNFDAQADEDWEQEMGMAPETDFATDPAQVYDAEEPFTRSPSPEIAAPTRSPSVEINAHRSPSVEIVAYNRAPSVVIESPPVLQPVDSIHSHGHLATCREVDAWVTSVKSASQWASRTISGRHFARIRADTAPAAAQALFTVLVHILQKPDGRQKTFQAPPGVTSCEKSVKVTSFTHLDCDLRV